MNRGASNGPQLIQDVVARPVPHQAATPQSQAIHAFVRLNWPAKRKQQRAGNQKKLLLRAQAKRQAELTELYKRFRKHPEHDAYDGI